MGTDAGSPPAIGWLRVDGTVDGTLKFVFRAVFAGNAGLGGKRGMHTGRELDQAEYGWTQEWVLRVERLLLLTGSRRLGGRVTGYGGWLGELQARRRRGLLVRIDFWEHNDFK